MEHVTLVTIAAFLFGISLYYTTAYIVDLISDILMKGSKISGYAINFKIAIFTWSLFYGITHL